MSQVRPPRAYEVALSFAGEDRAYVKRVAETLQEKGVRVFYDEYEEATLWGKNLYTHLRSVYSEQAEFMVMFVSRAYSAKLWTSRERESAQERAFEERGEYILPARFDDTEVPGLLKTTAYVDLRHKTPEELAELIIRKLRSVGIRTSGGVTVPPRDWKKIAWIAGGIGLLAAIVTFATGLFHRANTVAPATQAEPAAVTFVPLRRSIAVLDFRNASGDAGTAWLGTAIQQILTSDLAANGKLRVTSADEVARVEADLSLGATDEISPGMLQRVQKMLNVDSVVTGTYSFIGEPSSHLLSLEAHIAGKAPSMQTGSDEGLGDIVLRLGRDLRQHAGFEPLVSEEALTVAASIPKSSEVMRLYSKGLAALRRFDVQVARDALSRAVRDEPEFPLAHSALAEACSKIGDQQQAIAEAAQAVDHSRRLSQEQQLRIRAGLHRARNEWERTAEIERQLWTLFPDNLEYGLALAEAQVSNSDADSAHVTTAALRRTLAPPLSDDARIDLVDSEAYQSASDPTNQKKSAIAAADKAGRAGAKTILARARLLEAWSHVLLREIPDATKAAEDAQSFYLATGDAGNAARSVEIKASALDGVDYEMELKLYQQALDVHRKLGDQESVARVCLNIATTLIWMGRNDESAKSLNDSLSVFRALKNRNAEATAQNQIGAQLFDHGELGPSEVHYHAALKIFQSLPDDSIGIATTLVNLGEVRECRGRLDEAKTLYGKALAKDSGVVGNNSGVAYDQFRMGWLWALQDDSAVARQSFRNALESQTASRDAMSAADSRVALASLSIDEGKAVEVERDLREAEQILRAGRAWDRSLWSRGVLAECLLAQGRPAEAAEVADHMEKLAKNTKNLRLRLSIAIIRERVRAASRKPDDVAKALRSLGETRVEASRRGFVVSELEARLASGEIEVAAGQLEGKKHLLDLACEATAKGLKRIARRASKLSGRPCGGV